MKNIQIYTSFENDSCFLVEFDTVRLYLSLMYVQLHSKWYRHTHSFLWLFSIFDFFFAVFRTLSPIFSFTLKKMSTKKHNLTSTHIFLFFSFIFPFFLFLFFYGKASNKKTNLEENPTPTEGIVSKKRKNLKENTTSTKGIITYIANKCT